MSTVHIELADRTADLTLTEKTSGEHLSAWSVHDADQNYLGHLVYQDTGYEAHVNMGVYRPYNTREKALSVLLTAANV